MTAKREKPLAWVPAFLAELTETGVVERAARKAGIARSTAYGARRHHPQFAQSWDVACAPTDRRRREIAPLSAPQPIPPEPVKPPSRRWPIRFFEALAETSNVSASAALANVTPRVVYKRRREDAEFASRWLAALHEGYDNLEMELLGYLREPRGKPKMDVAAALRLLAAHRETVARYRALQDEEDEQTVLDSIDAFIEDIRQRRAANAAILIEADDECETGDGAD
jgi:hypothetical protein